MATAKKKATTKPASKAVVKSGSREVVTADFLAELQAKASGIAATVKLQGEGNFVSTKAGRFSFKGDSWGDSIDVVILTHAHTNNYYPGAYDPDVKGNTPACYAISPNGDNMAPFDDVPSKQNPTCAGCWASEIGSAEVGKGRACKQQSRVAFVLSSDIESAEHAAEAKILTVSVPAMSKDNLTKFIKVTADNPKFKMPPFAVNARMKLVKHDKYQYVVEFQPLDVIDDMATIKVLMSRSEGEAADLVMAKYQKKSDDKADTKEGGSRAAPAAKKKAALAKSATRGGRSRFGN